MNQHIPVDLIQLISEFCDVLTALRIVQLNKETNKKIRIISLIDELGNLNDHILNQKKFRNLIRLDVWNNPRVKNIKHLKKLKELDVGYNCGVDDEQIKKLD